MARKPKTTTTNTTTTTKETPVSAVAANLQDLLIRKYGKVKLTAAMKDTVDSMVSQLRHCLPTPAVFEKPAVNEAGGYDWNGTNYESKTAAYAAYKLARLQAFNGEVSTSDINFTCEGLTVQAADLYSRCQWNCYVLKGDNAGKIHGVGSYLGVNKELVSLLVFLTK